MFDLDEMVAKAKDFAAKTLIGEPGAEIPPMFDVVLGNGDHALAVTPWRDGSDKDAILDILRAKMAAEGAVAYLSISEAWMLRVDKSVDKPLDMDKLPRPSQSPKRIEVVMIAATDGKICRSVVLTIKRDEKGVVSALEELPDASLTSMGGRLLSLLGGPDQKPQTNA